MEDEVMEMVAEIRRRQAGTWKMDPAVAAAGPVLKVEGVSKRFCRDLKRSLLYGVYDIGREITGRPPVADRLRRHEFWALQDMSFEIKRGSAVGIVGTNGCGKTTLMRMLAGLIKPTKGQITTHGRMAPLLALGAGFIPVLTGRENIFTNMSILGLTKEEIEARFHRVVEFSEIGYALDAPVQSFSSGMMARLGFACAIETQPDILVLDEVLAVGDLKFKEKCLMQLLGMKQRGASMIIVHHSTDLLEKLCDEVIYIHKGKLVMQGNTQEVLDRYEQDLDLEVRQKKTRAPKFIDPAAEAVIESPEVQIVSVKVISQAGGQWQVGAAGEVEVTVNVLKPCARLSCRVIFHRTIEEEDGMANVSPTLNLSSALTGEVPRKTEAGRYVFRLRIPVVRLPRGEYYLRAVLQLPPHETTAAAWSPRFEVGEISRRATVKQYLQEHEWSVVRQEENLSA